jgi:undecaprenyl-diphosphatase
LTAIDLRGAVGAAALLTLFLACAFVGGAAGGIDSAVAAQAAAIRASAPFLLHSALVLTQLGSAPFTLGLGAAGALLLAARHHHGRAAILLVTIITERLAVDGLKLFFGRARPVFDTDLVHVHNLSFPSGHSANSLTAYLLLACFLATGRYRTAAIAMAFAITFIVGLTRILIGVHWLSDVVGGWAAGLIAVMLALAADRRLSAPEQ